MIVGDGDCNPADGSVFPGHLSNESDPNDCYFDVDGDGWGDSNPPPKPSVVNYDVGQDCEDDKNWVYPAAPEECNGIAEDCTDPNYGGSPFLESDDDGDGFVECVDFDPSTWVGSQSVLDAYNLGQGGAATVMTMCRRLIQGAAYVTNPNACLNDSMAMGLWMWIGLCVRRSSTVVMPVLFLLFQQRLTLEATKQLRAEISTGMEY